MSEELKSLYNWFDINRASIIAGHEGERVLLANNAVIGYFPTKESALKIAFAKKLKYGEFLVQWCITAEEETKRFSIPAAYRGYI